MTTAAIIDKFSDDAKTTLNTLRDGQRVSERDAARLRKELSTALKVINKKLFTARGDAWAKGQQALAQEVVNLLERHYFQNK